MDPVVAALIGAGVGAVVPSVTNLMASRQARQVAREARLFDHLREAYAVFLNRASFDLETIAEWYWKGDGKSGAEPPEGCLDPVHKSQVDVSLYGTSEIDRLATEVLDAMRTFTFKEESFENYGVCREAIDDFVKRARKDLGTPRR